jgi:hypothetical protein
VLSAYSMNRSVGAQLATYQILALIVVAALTAAVTKSLVKPTSCLRMLALQVFCSLAKAGDS